MTPVLVERPVERVCRIVLNRPDALNAVDGDLREALEAAIRTANADPQTRVIILAGAGAAFSAGGDLTFMQSLGPTLLQEFHERLLGIVRAIATSPKVTIAAVQGACAGGALGFALACDHVVAAWSARFSAPFLRIGLVPDMGSIHFLHRRIGAQTTRRFLLDGLPIEAAEAERAGLCDRLVADTQLVAEAEALAARAAGLAPDALARTKRLLACAEPDLDAFLAQEIAIASPCLGGAEFVEGVRAFRDKRPAVFA